MRGVFERPAGSGIWWINYYDSDGRRHREKIGRESVAIEAFLHRRAEIREARFVAPRSGAKLKFRELADQALANKKLRLSPRSAHTDELRMSAVKEVLGESPASAISPARIESFLESLAEKKVRGKRRLPPTLNRYRSLLSSIFSFGVRSGKVRLNPVGRVRRFKESDHRVRWLDADEEEALRQALRSLSPLYEAEMDLALHTGMRRGEQYGLKWADIDLRGGVATVRGKSGKRFVHLNSVAREAFKTLWRASNGSSYVCPDKRSDDQQDFRRWFEKACKAAKIDNFHWHDLRHTFASRFLMSGGDLRGLQLLLGHRSIVTTMRYAHLSEEHQKKNVERIANWHQDGTALSRQRADQQQVLPFQQGARSSAG